MEKKNNGLHVITYSYLSDFIFKALFFAKMLSENNILSLKYVPISLCVLRNSRLRVLDGWSDKVRRQFLNQQTYRLLIRLLARPSASSC